MDKRHRPVALGTYTDVRGKPQSINMASKSKKVKISSRYFENNINWETKFAEIIQPICQKRLIVSLGVHC